MTTWNSARYSDILQRLDALDQHLAMDLHWMLTPAKASSFSKAEKNQYPYIGSIPVSATHWRVCTSVLLHGVVSVCISSFQFTCAASCQSAWWTYACSQPVVLYLKTVAMSFETKHSRRTSWRYFSAPNPHQQPFLCTLISPEACFNCQRLALAMP
jgi:hypothetical protein